MSRTTERALEAVQESHFNFKDANTIEVINAFIFWSNFRGEANKFGNTARTFNLAINEGVAGILKENGWRVRQVDHEDGSVLYFVNIKVNMNSAYPPIITLYSEFRGKRSRRTLDIENVSELDRINSQSADCVINAYASKMYPGKVTGYLKKLNIIQEPDIEFGGKYDDWMEEDGRESLLDPDDEQE
jgi:hypothetical protein